MSLDTNLTKELADVERIFLLELKNNLSGFRATSEFIKEIATQPSRDFSGMLLSPFQEQLVEAMAPLNAALAPIIEDITNVLGAILRPILTILFKIVELSGPFIDQLSRLLGWTPEHPMGELTPEQLALLEAMEEIGPAPGYPTIGR